MRKILVSLTWFFLVTVDIFFLFEIDKSFQGFKQDISKLFQVAWADLVDGVIKVDYLDFSCEKFEILCELDVGVIACNF